MSARQKMQMKIKNRKFYKVSITIIMIFLIQFLLITKINAVSVSDIQQNAKSVATEEDSDDGDNSEGARTTPDENAGSTPDENTGTTPDENAGSTPDENTGTTPDENAG